MDNVFYRIDMPGHIRHKQGDTFSEISHKVGISVETLQQLNPHIDQFTLQSGDRVKLR